MSPSRRRETPPQDELMLARANMTGALQADYESDNLTTTYDDLEKKVNAASGLGKLSTYDGFVELQAASDRARQLSEAAGDLATTRFFTAKVDSYRTLLETVVPKPQARPKPTDTSSRDMGRPKSDKKR